MLTPDRIIPFLTHQDPGARKLALSYLSQAHDPSPATADDIWKSIDAFGPGENSGTYYDLARMPQTDASLQRTINALNGDLDSNEREFLEKILANLKYSLLMRFADLIDEVPNLSPKLRDHLKQRTELSTLPAAELWDQLMQFGEKMSREDKDAGQIDWAVPRRIVEALSHSPESAGWAISTLNDTTITDWREVFAVDLLGALRFRSAAEIVLQKLISDEDADSLIESCTDALVRMGNAQIVELVQKRFPEMDGGFRLHAAGVFRRVKVPQSEVAAFALLEEESDLTVRTHLAWALCELTTTHPPAMDRMITMVREHDYNRNLMDLDENVAALCVILGRPKPVVTSASRPSTYNSLRSAFADTSHKVATSSTASPKLPVSFDQPTPQSVPRSVRRQGIKVGRNDPCPCGSRKKYKKCCGK